MDGNKIIKNFDELTQRREKTNKKGASSNDNIKNFLDKKKNKDIVDEIMSDLEETFKKEDTESYNAFIALLNKLKENKTTKKLLKAIFSRYTGKFEVETGVEVAVNKCHPTQNEIDARNSLGRMVGITKKGEKDEKIKDSDIDKQIDKLTGKKVKLGIPVLLFSNGGDDYAIIDGHHRWSQISCANPEGTMEAVVLKNSELKAIEVLKVAQEIIAEVDPSTEPNPVGNADKEFNLYDLSEKEIAKKMNEWLKLSGRGNGFLEAVKKHIDLEKNKKAGVKEISGLDDAIKIIAYNAANLAPIVPGAPNRDVMPQCGDIKKLGDDSYDKVEAALKNAEFPVKEHSILSFDEFCELNEGFFFNRKPEAKFALLIEDRRSWKQEYDMYTRWRESEPKLRHLDKKEAGFGHQKFEYTVITNDKALEKYMRHIHALADDEKFSPYKMTLNRSEIAAEEARDRINNVFKKRVTRLSDTVDFKCTVIKIEHALRMIKSGEAKEYKSK